jgi:hypothetical protein
MRYVLAAIAALLIGAGLALWHELRCIRIQEEFKTRVIVSSIMHWPVTEATKPERDRAIRKLLDSAAENLGHPLDEEQLQHLASEQIYEEARIRVRSLPWFLHRDQYEIAYRELGVPMR